MMASLLLATLGALAATAEAAEDGASGVAAVAPSRYANLITTRMGGLSPEEIALLMSMLDDNGDGELTCESLRDPRSTARPSPPPAVPASPSAAATVDRPCPPRVRALLLALLADLLTVL